MQKDGELDEAICFRNIGLLLMFDLGSPNRKKTMPGSCRHDGYSSTHSHHSYYHICHSSSFPKHDFTPNAKKEPHCQPLETCRGSCGKAKAGECGGGKRKEEELGMMERWKSSLFIKKL